VIAGAEAPRRMKAGKPAEKIAARPRSKSPPIHKDSMKSPYVL
jgi:hypothetical protein